MWTNALERFDLVLPFVLLLLVLLLLILLLISPLLFYSSIPFKTRYFQSKRCLMA